MKSETYTCDVCGATKQDGDRGWWSILIEPLLRQGQSRPALTLTSFESFSTWHLCGPACVGRKVQEFLSADRA